MEGHLNIAHSVPFNQINSLCIVEQFVLQEYKSCQMEPVQILKGIFSFPDQNHVFICETLTFDFDKTGLDIEREILEVQSTEQIQLETR